jgi:hypothetical protein
MPALGGSKTPPLIDEFTEHPSYAFQIHSALVHAVNKVRMNSYNFTSSNLSGSPDCLVDPGRSWEQFPSILAG